MIFAILGEKKQSEISEIQFIIFKENNDNPYEIHNNYIKLSIVFHPMII
jgi:hypothetical protein